MITADVHLVYFMLVGRWRAIRERYAGNSLENLTATVNVLITFAVGEVYQCAAVAMTAPARWPDGAGRSQA